MTITENSPNLNVKVLIVGAGLGGLALGINLIQKGHTVTILEAAPKLGEVGAGIQVPPNSVKLLARMGVYEKVFPTQLIETDPSLRRQRLGHLQSRSSDGKMAVRSELPHFFPSWRR